MGCWGDETDHTAAAAAAAAAAAGSATAVADGWGAADDFQSSAPSYGGGGALGAAAQPPPPAEQGVMRRSSFSGAGRVGAPTALGVGSGSPPTQYQFHGRASSLDNVVGAAGGVMPGGRCATLVLFDFCFMSLCAVRWESYSRRWASYVRKTKTIEPSCEMKNSSLFFFSFFFVSVCVVRYVRRPR